MRDNTQYGHDGAWIGIAAAAPEPFAGAYILGDDEPIMVWLEERPSWFHRTMMRFCFGWDWVDIEPTKSRVTMGQPGGVFGR